MAILRIVKSPSGYSTITHIDLIEGDIEKDREYWKKHHNVKARYFELKEITEVK